MLQMHNSAELQLCEGDISKMAMVSARCLVVQQKCHHRVMKEEGVPSPTLHMDEGSWMEVALLTAVRLEFSAAQQDQCRKG
jgi:hypothetical protein